MEVHFQMRITRISHEDFIIAHDVALSGHDSNNLKAELKRVYFGAIDSIVSSMKERLDKKTES